jgi:hypothetical protein
MTMGESGEFLSSTISLKLLVILHFNGAFVGFLFVLLKLVTGDENRKFDKRLLADSVINQFSMK